MPLSMGQLTHAYVFDPDCFPAQFTNLMTRFAPQYIQGRPEGYPNNLPWPEARGIVDSLAEQSGLKYPYVNRLRYLV